MTQLLAASISKKARMHLNLHPSLPPTAHSAKATLAPPSEQSWAEATTAFLQSDSGASWPGGEKNKTILGQILIDNGLVDSPDKLEAISAAFDFARENGLLVPNEEAETLQRINEVTSPSELRALLQPSERQYRVQQGIQSGIWGK